MTPLIRPLSILSLTLLTLTMLAISACEGAEFHVAPSNMDTNGQASEDAQQDKALGDAASKLWDSSSQYAPTTLLSDAGPNESGYDVATDTANASKADAVADTSPVDATNPTDTKTCFAECVFSLPGSDANYVSSMDTCQGLCTIGSPCTTAPPNSHTGIVKCCNAQGVCP